jgi:hydroxymethylpyrimidine/phosphomethylpyrimidine kinase
VSESGAELLAPEARRALVAHIAPRATAVTPNVPEARALAALAAAAGRAVEAGAQASAAGRDPAGRAAATGAGRPDEPEALARTVRGLGAQVVVLTGGHRERAVDLFFDGERMVEIPGPRHPDGAAHGSGCTHSSVLAARLAWGDDPLLAARTAKQLAAEAVADGLVAIGRGAGPVNVLGLGVRP